MTPDEAWSAWSATRDPIAHDFLARHYQGLARAQAHKVIMKAPPHQDPGEIHSYALRGLDDALNKFDPSARHADGESVKFETYAIRRIQGEIIDELRRADPLTRPLRKRVKALERAISAIEESGNPATVEALAEATGEAPDKVKVLLLERQSMAVHLDPDEPHKSDDHEIDVHITDLRGRLAQRLAHLPPPSLAYVLTHYVDDVTTLKAASARLRTSGDELRRMRQQTLHMLSA